MKKRRKSCDADICTCLADVRKLYYHKEVIIMKKTWTLLFAAVMLALGIGAAAPAEAADIQVEIDGQAVTFDQPPVIENDRVMVPMRALAEALGAEVGWDGDRRMMTSVRGDDTLYIDIGKYVMWRNDQPIFLDAAPMIVAGRTLAPIRAISEGYDATVDWDGVQRKVTVTTDAAAFPPEEKPPVDEPSDVDSYAYEVFELTNEERRNAGLDPFVWSDALAEVAYAHSKDMSVRGFFSHDNPDGLSPFDRMENAGISYWMAAENIAAGHQTPADVVEGWMTSPGHRANILDPGLHKLGVGFYTGSSGYGTYWTQCFTD